MFWAALSPPMLGAMLVISHLGEGQPRATAGSPGQLQAEKGMSQWKMRRLLACGNALEKPGQAAGKSRSCLPLPRLANPGAGWRGGLNLRALKGANGCTEPGISIPALRPPPWTMPLLCLAALRAWQTARCRGRDVSHRASLFSLSAQRREGVAGERTPIAGSPAISSNQRPRRWIRGLLQGSCSLHPSYCNFRPPFKNV